METVDPRRVRVLKDGTIGPGPVFYWMSRDQRARDNWALLYAQERALELKRPLGVVFCLAPSFMAAPLRHYDFMLRGLKETSAELKRKNIPFILLYGDPDRKIPAFIERQKGSLLVTDFDPLRIKRGWKERVASEVRVPFEEVDAHNIVPCWVASQKQEYGAYTLRPKIKKLLPEFLTEFPALKWHPAKRRKKIPPQNWKKAAAFPHADDSVKAVKWIEPGEGAAEKSLKHFISKKLVAYPDDRNDPAIDGTSGLSPYLHFGQLSAQRIALSVSKCKAPRIAREAFLEELVVRRELSDNYCFYNPHYDSVAGFPAWAKKTLGHHRDDPREYIYPRDEFEKARTHDPLWNAAQTEMVRTGKMHGYMRMYWGKKILEWTPSPEDAMRIAIALNDRYELDGRDPNGYTGIAWSIGGVHDRAWSERPVFGKIRFMNANGCRSKFDVNAYLRKVIALKETGS